MKKRILSIVMMLAVAFTLAIGSAVMASAADGDSTMALNLADNITAKITFEALGDTAAVAEVTVAGKDAEGVTLEKDGADALLCVPVAVKDVKSNIVVTLKDAGGATLVSEKLFKASDYLADVKADDSKALYHSIADSLSAYADVAANYFSGAALDAPAAPSIAAAAKFATSGSVAGLTHDSVTLILESKTAIRHYFLLDGKTKDDYTFYVDLDGDGGYDKVEEVVAFDNAGYVCVDITGITPNDLDKAYTVKVTDGASTYSCTYSAMDYVIRAFENGSSASNARKAISNALNGYFSSADTIGAKVTYMDGDNVLKEGFYNYGVDNYIDYFPTKSGTALLGWYADADFTTLVNCIEAGTEGDVVLYSRWSNGGLFNSAPNQFIDSISISEDGFELHNYWVDHEHYDEDEDELCDECLHAATCTVDMSGAFADRADKEACPCGYAYKETIKWMGNTYNNYPGVYVEKGEDANGQSYVMLDFDRYADTLTGNYYGITALNKLATTTDTSNGFIRGLDYYDSTSKITISMQLGRASEEGKTIPLSFRINNENKAFFYVHTDGAVYLGDATNAGKAEYKIMDLPVGELATVTVTVDISGIKRDGSSCTLTVSAEGVENTVSGSGAFASARGVVAQFLTAGNGLTGLAGERAGIMVGKIEFATLSESQSYVTSEELGIVTSYTPGEATRLPAGASKTGYDFLGWYSDAELTNKINSIPAGNCSNIVVYPKWVAATQTIDAGQKVNGNLVFEKTNVAYGKQMEALDWCYSYSVAFDPSTMTTASAAIIRQRISGVAADGKDWAKYYQANTHQEIYDIITKNTFGSGQKNVVYDIAADLELNILATNETPEENKVAAMNGSDAILDAESNPVYFVKDALEAYLAGMTKYAPNSHNIVALRVENGIVKTMNKKALANPIEANAYITYVCDYKNQELRYYVDGQYVCTESIAAYILYDDNGGLGTYGPYSSKESLRFLNWQKTNDFNFLASAITLGDIYGTPAVIYDVTDGTVIADPEGSYSTTIEIGETIEKLPTSVTKNGNAFMGWFVVGANTPAEEYIGKVGTSVTLYAKYPITVNLTYETNGGALPTSGTYTESYTPGKDDVTLPTLTKESATFLGWYYEADYQTSVTAESLVDLTTDTKLYARWSDKTAVWDKENLTPGTNDTFVSGYNLGNDMKTAETNMFTLRIDTATSGSIGWDLYINRDDASAIRLRNGWAAGTNTNGECRVIYFANGNMTTYTGVVLTAMNSGDVVDLVFDIAAKTITYYVNGEFKITETANTLNNHMMFDSIDAYNSGEGYTEAGYTRTRSHLFQVTQLEGRKLAYDFCGAYVGNLYE